MIFAGDVALGPQGLNLILPDSLAKKPWLVNLEGSLVKDGKHYIPINGVFNDYDAISHLRAKINLKAVSLANNHVLDASPICSTKVNLKELGIPYIGAGDDLEDSARTINIDGYTIVAFGWGCIECPLAKNNQQGVNPYNKKNIVAQISSLLNAGKKVICFFHWNYELELYPHPFDRELSHYLIDLGVSAIVGAHSHRVQHIEIYKGVPIVYGLGNFMFSRNIFFNRRHSFGERSNIEIVFEINNSNSFFIHTFVHDEELNVVKYVKTKEYSSDSLGDAPYINYSNDEYIHFFKKNRIQKKMLPIFYYNDSLLLRILKVKFVAIRGFLLKVLVKLNVKSQKRK